MIPKILHILSKILLSLLAFYLILGFILLPMVLTFAVPAVGTKMLKRPVHVRYILINPILLQVSARGLEVLDTDNKPMIGFDRLFVDVSFFKLLQKTIYVESVELNGLKVNAALSKDGKINLMDLATAVAPQGQTKAQPPAKPAAASAKPATGAKPTASTAQSASPALPLIIIKDFALHGGEVHFVDRSINPNFSTVLSGMELHVTNISTKPDEAAKVDFQTKIDDKGIISSQAVVKPLAKPLEMEATLALNAYAMQVLTPYVGKYTGHELKDGKMDFKMDYRIGANKLTASHQLLIQHFEFGSKVNSKDALSLPFGLAVALLEDPQGRINFNLPVSGDMSDPKFHYWHLLGQVASNTFIKIVTKPFSFLGSMMGYSGGSSDELGYVRFLPGKADLSDKEKEKLGVLIKALKERPKLQLSINGSYDPQVDWKAMQYEIFTRDYNALRKISTRSEAAVYEQLYQRRFGIRALWALSKKYKKGVGEYEDVQLSQAIKKALIESAPPDKGALSVLAQARAQQVHEALIALGLDEKRLAMGQEQPVVSSMGTVPLQLTLTVFQ